MEMFAGMATEALDNACACADEEEMADGNPATIKNREKENGNTDSGNAPGEIIGAQDGPDAGEPFGGGLIAEHVIDEPFDGPWLKQIDER
jgi:hypothetical protein